MYGLIFDISLRVLVRLLLLKVPWMLFRGLELIHLALVHRWSILRLHATMKALLRCLGHPIDEIVVHMSGLLLLAVTEI